MNINFFYSKVKFFLNKYIIYKINYDHRVKNTNFETL